MIGAIDFDGTLVDHIWPDPTFRPRLATIARVKQRKAEGDKLILWTCRTGEALQQAIDYLRDEHDLTFDAHNENIPNPNYAFPTSAKVYADYYLDDKAINVRDFT